MGDKKAIKIVLLICFVAMIMAGCASSAYKNVFNDEKSPNAKTFNASLDECYFAAKRAVLSQNFRIEREDL